VQVLADVEIELFLCHFVRKWKCELDPPNQEWKLVRKSFTEADPYPTMKFTSRDE